MIFLDEALISIQRGVFKKLLQKVGSNLYSGKSVMDISFPVCVFSTESMLMRMGKMVQFFPNLVETIRKESDHLLKFARFVGYFTGFQNLNLDQKKPFNPIWGETYQCSIEDLEYVVEQVLHHPPISNFYMSNTNKTLE